MIKRLVAEAGIEPVKLCVIDEVGQVYKQQFYTESQMFQLAKLVVKVWVGRKRSEI